MAVDYDSVTGGSRTFRTPGCDTSSKQPAATRQLFRLIVVMLGITLITPEAVGQQSAWRPTNGPMAAHVSAIAVDADGTVYAGTFKEGVFRSENDGHSWTRIGLDLVDVRGLVIEPGGQLLVGTFGDGVYKSSDRGESWEGLNVGLADPRVQALISDGEGAILAGTFGSGVFRLEGGAWQPSNDGLTDIDVRSLAFGRRGTAYAACRRGGVFASSDSGRTWALLDGGSRLGALRFVFARGNQVVAAGWVGGIARNYSREGAWTPIANGLPNQKVWTVA
ncbi:MAG: hypothetical protein HKN13_03290, partial [Rhodothermales bacterium]|nr:hypothetical protein [Rhodothermales bacterium]